MSKKKDESHVNLVISVFLATSVPIALRLFMNFTTIGDIGYVILSSMYLLFVILIIYYFLDPEIKNTGREIIKMIFIIGFSFLPFLLERSILTYGLTTNSIISILNTTIFYVIFIVSSFVCYNCYFYISKRISEFKLYIITKTVNLIRFTISRYKEIDYNKLTENLKNITISFTKTYIILLMILLFIFYVPSMSVLSYKISIDKNEIIQGDILRIYFTINNGILSLDAKDNVTLRIEILDYNESKENAHLGSLNIGKEKKGVAEINTQNLAAGEYIIYTQLNYTQNEKQMKPIELTLRLDVINVTISEGVAINRLLMGKI